MLLLTKAVDKGSGERGQGVSWGPLLPPPFSGVKFFSTLKRKTQNFYTWITFESFFIEKGKSDQK